MTYKNIYRRSFLVIIGLTKEFGFKILIQIFSLIVFIYTYVSPFDGTE